ncbi:glycoside hydrolase family 43 protein [Chitinophaga sp.]|uniref:glycoside hydrolase family 43 protein n=1 Tax=Chitinophaga sp. TaxID=1869181 RepID=UPI002DBD7FE2|nr:glycoside hydrolase family 43 protein [Chitinophaga sp.]
MSNRMLYLVLLAFTIACSRSSDAGGTVDKPDTTGATFTNPLLPGGPDPWVFFKDGKYYYTSTLGNRVGVRVTNKMSALKDAPLVTLWTPPADGPYSREIWAPEIHFVQGKWYVYFAADNGSNDNHRMYVIENGNADPTQGSWTFKGKIADATDKWAIDGSVFEYNSKLYMIWSGWEGDTNEKQQIYIAPLSNPWTIGGDRVMISTPTYDWEKRGNSGGLPQVNEGPEALISPTGRLFLTYSASGCWTDDYALGLLTLKEGGDPLNAADWQKSATPVFSKSESSGAFGPGHNGFFKSVDQKESWIIYHANPLPGQGCGNNRSPRMQPFTWKADGTPDFGQPANIAVPLQVPSGE